ncbi:MAG: TetR/AcrR family transcriptional regulator [Actinomycetota bacterium]
MNAQAKARRLRADEHRAALVEAATARFAADTYGGVRVQDIVADAGVSLTTFYKDFDDREACLHACFLVMRDELMGVILTASAEENNPRLRTRALIGAVLTHLDTNPDQARLLLLETIGGSPRTVDELWKMLAELGVFVDSLNVRAVEEGTARPIELDDVGLFVAGGLYTVIAHHLRAGTLGDLRRDEDALDGVVDALYAATAALIDRSEG